MTNRTTTPTAQPPAQPAAQQLALLADAEVTDRFRLDARTRERGLAHVAAIRRQLEARAAARREHPAEQAA